MILAFDSYYLNGKTQTACVLFEKWTDSNPLKIITNSSHTHAEYESGAFYKRELPGILDVLKSINLYEVECIVIDGYVLLDDEGKLGLGGHLYNSLNCEVPVIGVAKTKYKWNNTNNEVVLRGDSKTPLYITSLGIPLTEASTLIRSMHGNYRIPTLLKCADTESKRDMK